MGHLAHLFPSVVSLGLRRRVTLMKSLSGPWWQGKNGAGLPCGTLRPRYHATLPACSPRGADTTRRPGGPRHRDALPDISSGSAADGPVSTQPLSKGVLRHTAPPAPLPPAVPKHSSRGWGDPEGPITICFYPLPVFACGFLNPCCQGLRDFSRSLTIFAAFKP